MSTNTANYGLHQWAGEDKFLRTDFNTDMQKIDTGIKAAYDRAGTVEASLTNAISQKADASALTALQTTVNGKADASALAALQTTVNSKANSSTVTALQGTVNGKADKSTVTALQSQMPVKLELGAVSSYTGDGEYPRTINVGFRPKLVFIELTWGTTYAGNGTYGGWFTAELPLLSSKSPCTQITDTGFVLDYSELNQKSRVYHYLCLK